MPSYVVYYIVPLHQSGDPKLYANQAIAQQEKKVQDYLNSHENSTVIKTFIESGDNFRYRHRWPELEAAIAFCIENQAHLLIAELRNLTHNESFADRILALINYRSQSFDSSNYQGNVIFCDQPFINRENFHAIAEHAKQQKMQHGQLIRAGLNRTTAKSGNPNALDVIAKVNRPKIENAIVFALLLQPVIADYQARGYSQRKMVEMLNEEGFTAPEGGHWVLSQLQKVLDRIKINELALSLENQFRELSNQGFHAEHIAQKLNENQRKCPFAEQWSADIITKVQERITRIHDIIKHYHLAVEFMPVIQKYHVDELTDATFVNELEKSGIIHPWGHA